MSAVLAAALLAKAVFVLLLLLSCVSGQQDVCASDASGIWLFMCTPKGRLDAGKAGEEEDFLNTFLGEEGRLGVSGEEGR